MPVRALKHDDLDALLDLYTHLHEADEAVPARERVLRVWDQMLGNPMLHCLGLELDGQLVSSCILTITPNLTRGTRPYGQIETVVTHAGYRRRGLGEQLIRHALNSAWEHGCYKVMLMTGKLQAHEFYVRCGFREGVKTGFVAYP